jgi:DNA-binding MarR family transcriptional regulator
LTKSVEHFANSYIFYGLIRGLNFAIENDIRKDLKSNELTFPSFRILWILYFDSNISMSSLTYITQTNISNVFRQLTKLNEDGLVTIESGEDARIRTISLTGAGRKVVDKFIYKNTTSSELEIVHLIDKITKEDLSKFIEVSLLITQELLGEPFSKFITQSTNEILNKSYTPKKNNY